MTNFPMSERLNDVSEGAEILYLRLLAQSDDNANYFGSPSLILGYLFAHRMESGTVTVESVKSRLTELEKAGLVTKYENVGHQYIHLACCYRHVRTDIQPDVRFPVAPGTSDVRNAYVPRAKRKRPVRGPIDETIQDEKRLDKTIQDGDGCGRNRSPKQQALDAPLQAFADAYKQVYGKDYVFSSGRDHKTVQLLMGKAAPADFLTEFKARIAVAIKQHTPGNQWDEFPKDLTLFKARWNKLVDTGKAGPIADVPYETLNERLRRQGDIP